jgi:hypothetical protein
MRLSRLLLLTTLFLLLLPTKANAQLGAGEDEESEVSTEGIELKFGVHAGGTYMTQTDIPIEDSRRLGFVGGASLSIDFPGPFTLRPEVNYIQKGAGITRNSSGIKTDTRIVTMKQSYMEVPLLAEFDIPLGNNFSPFFLIGPFGSLNITSKAVYGEQSDRIFAESPDRFLQDLQDGTEKVDFGAAFGGGSKFYIGSTVLRVDFRYSLGLYDTRRHPENDSPVFKNRGFITTVGVAF